MIDPYYEKVARVIARTFRAPMAEISIEAARGQLTGWDSIGHITLMMEIENEFGVCFPTDQINEANTIGRICELLKQTNAKP